MKNCPAPRAFTPSKNNGPPSFSSQVSGECDWRVLMSHVTFTKKAVNRAIEQKTRKAAERSRRVLLYFCEMLT